MKRRATVHWRVWEREREREIVCSKTRGEIDEEDV